VVDEFRRQEDEIATRERDDGLNSNLVFRTVRPALKELGYDVDHRKEQSEKIRRPTERADRFVWSLPVKRRRDVRLITLVGPVPISCTIMLRL